MSFESQGVTQAVLVRGAALDPDQVSERLALFDETTGQPYPFVGEPWIDIPNSAMSNGWKNVQGAPSPQYRKRPNGQVELRGRVASGVKGTIFKLPEGYRPTFGSGLYFMAASDRGTPATVMVKTNGDVSVEFLPVVVQQQPAPPPPPPVPWFSLAAITYSID